MANSLKLFFFYQRWQTENQTGLHFYVSLSKGADLFIYLAYFLSHFPSLCIFPAFCKSQAFADCLFMEIGDFLNCFSKQPAKQEASLFLFVKGLNRSPWSGIKPNSTNVQPIQGCWVCLWKKALFWDYVLVVFQAPQWGVPIPHWVFISFSSFVGLPQIRGRGKFWCINAIISENCTNTSHSGKDAKLHLCVDCIQIRIKIKIKIQRKSHS